MRTRKVLFLEASGGGGHISITTSIVQALGKLAPSIESERVDVMPRLAHKLYRVASRQFVNAFLLLYKATDNRRGEVFASRLSGIVSRKKLTQAIVDYEPDLIFSNYSLAIDEVAEILERIGRKIPFIVFVPDPFTPHSIYFSKKTTLTLVSTLVSYQIALARGIPPEKIYITGHPVREEFAQAPANKNNHKEKLGLDPNIFTILFGGSGHGAEKTLEILMYLGAKPSGNLIKRLIRSTNLDSKTYYKLFVKAFENQYTEMPKFQAICVCGDNTELKEDLGMLKFPSHIKAFIYQHTRNMADLIHASDIVVGKAGPNILFETAMAGKPIIGTYHIKGQEEGNVDFIRASQVGFVEEHPQNTAYLIQTILKNRDLLEYTRPGIAYAREAHKDAARKIAGQIIKLLYHSAIISKKSGIYLPELSKDK